MTLRMTVLGGGVVGAVAGALVIAPSTGLAAGVLLGLVGGALGSAAQYAVWGDRWNREEEAWNSGTTAQRRTGMRSSARRMLLGSLLCLALAGVVVAAVWLVDGDPPGLQAALLLLPSVLLLGGYAHATAKARRLK